MYLSDLIIRFTFPRIRMSMIRNLHLKEDALPHLLYTTRRQRCLANRVVILGHLRVHLHK